MQTVIVNIRRYILPFRLNLIATGVLSLINMLIDASTVALLAAMSQLVLNVAGMTTTAPTQTASTGPPLTLDLSAWYDYLIQLLNEQLAAHGLIKTLLALGSIYLAGRAVYMLIDVASVYLMWSAQVRGTRRMVVDMYNHISGLSMDFFNRNRVGELNSRISGDVNRYSSYLGRIMTILLNSLPLAIFYWMTLLRTNLTLSMLAVISFGLTYFVVQRISFRTRSWVIEMGRVMASMVVLVQESLSGISLTKAYAAEEFERRRFSAMSRETLRWAIRQGMAEKGIKPAVRFLQEIPIVLVLLYGAYLILGEQIDSSDFILFVLLMRQVRGPTLDLTGTLYIAYQQAVGFSDRLNELWTEKPTVKDGPQAVVSFEQMLALENVSFHYEADNEQEVLRDVTLSIEKGEVVALVGPSGAGKSTLVNMLLRFYDPVSGKITLDGQDIREFKQANYRRLFGVVTQETILFHDSVRNNIAYGLEPDAMIETDVIEAAKIANAHQFITELPNGYDTIIGDRGLRLSGGQRQRLAIARAVLRNPAVLMLDEATSSLDSESELLVQEAIERLLEGRTAIIIAHRLSTIRNADRIAAMEEGRIIEMGPHEELLAVDGLYRRLYETQQF